VHGVAGLFDNARGIGKDDLVVFAVEYALDAVARGLSFWGDGREWLADQGIDECGFADVGLADDVDKSRFVIMRKVWGWILHEMVELR